MAQKYAFFYGNPLYRIVFLLPLETKHIIITTHITPFNYLTMNKTELIAKAAESAGLSKVDAKKAIEAAIDAVKASLAAGEKVQIPGIITLSVAERPARTGKAFGKTVEIAAKKVVKIKAGSELEAAVK